MAKKEEGKVVAEQPAGTSLVEAPKGGALVDQAALEAELAAFAKDAAAAEAPVGAGISLRGGIIQWQGTPVPNNRLRCIVLDSVFENRMYTTKFSADNPTNPDCFALARVEADLAPHELAVNKQGGPEGMCAGCPMNAWKSDPDGGRGKACGEIRRLALIPATALEQESYITDAEIAILKLPVTSTRYWAAYINRLSAVLRRPPFAVVTEIYTEPHPKHQFHVHFNAVAPAPLELVAALKKKVEMAGAFLLAPYKPQTEAPAQQGSVQQRKF